LRIVLSNIGTWGDINPLIAIALELQSRGHTPVMAFPEVYSSKIKQLGLEYHPLRPELDPTNTILVEMIYDVKKGTERGLCEFLFPALRKTYDDLLDAATNPVRADLMMLGELNYAGPIVADRTGIPWASTVLAPFSFFSAFDPPVLPPYPKLASAEKFLPGMGHIVKSVARFATRKWPEPVYALRRELGLPPGPNPIFEAKNSPHLVLALFSDVLGVKQKDWPPNSLITGFCFNDSGFGDDSFPSHLEKFLKAGDPPLVFTLGSAAVLAAGQFYELSAQAAILLNRRAVLLIGSDARNRPQQRLPDSICVAEYAPFSTLFPRASAVVHQGGVGTTAQCLRAGRPMLIMPYSHDQPDNARRMRRMGVSKTIERSDYTPERIARTLSKLIDNPAYAARAHTIATQLAKEDGVFDACNALEALHATAQTNVARTLASPSASR
jgi:UDP:flavonoid glycosyltransferase YjiC (YdhE family)